MTMLLSRSQSPRVLRVLTPPQDDARSVMLPILTTAGDVREIVQYLRRKPVGVKVAEEMDRARRRLFEPRKLAAYQHLGILNIVGDSVELSPLGRMLAKELEPETRAFRHLLERTTPYWAALEWIYRQGSDIVTTTDLLSFWREQHAEAISGCDNDIAKGAVISFFNLCQAAELGTMTLGKRGHITRLSVDQEELRALFVGAPSTLNEADEDEGSIPGAIHLAPLLRPQPRRHGAEPLRMLVLAGSNNDTVYMLRRTLELADVESRLIEKDWAGKISFEEDELRRAPDCDAVLVVLDEKAFAEDDAWRHSIKETVLIEIGAARVLYNRRVVLFLDEKFSSSEAVRGLQCYEIVNGGMTWDAGIQLLEAVERFKNELATERGN